MNESKQYDSRQPLNIYECSLGQGGVKKTSKIVEINESAATQKTARIEVSIDGNGLDKDAIDEDNGKKSSLQS